MVASYLGSINFNVINMMMLYQTILLYHYWRGDEKKAYS